LAAVHAEGPSPSLIPVDGHTPSCPNRFHCHCRCCGRPEENTRIYAQPPLALNLLIGHSEARSSLAMPRPRYRQDHLPIGPDAPPAELFGPEQPNPPGLELMQQGQLQVVPLGPLFEEERQEEDESGVAELG